MTRQASKEEFLSLYGAADMFRGLECWRWMTDNIIWGAQNQENGEIGWCCVLGNLGELFGFVVYRGSRGLTSWLKMQNSRSKSAGNEAALNQDCLSLTYGNRKLLQPQDLKVVKELGLQYRGASQWPQFRDHLPGYFPWYLDAPGARLLTLSLGTVPLVARLAREKPEFYLSADEKSLRVFSPSAGEGGWTERWEKIPYEDMASLEVKPKTDFTVPADVAKLNIARHAAVELDVAMSIHPLGDKKGERPFFPRLLLVVDAGSGVIVSFHLFSPSETEDDIRQFLCGAFKDIRGIPGTIRVRQKGVAELMDPFATQLDLKVELVRSLPELRKAQRELEKYALR